MKVMFEFNMPEEQEELDMALKGPTCQFVVDEIHRLCFRPCFKHGYANEELQALVTGPSGESVVRAIELITQIYHDIKNAHNV